MHLPSLAKRATNWIVQLYKGFSLHFRCDYDFSILWTRELGHSPFAAAPLITDVDADGFLDVVAAPFSDELTVLQGRDGNTLKATEWPYSFVDISTHSSPLVVGDRSVFCALLCVGARKN